MSEKCTSCGPPCSQNVFAVSGFIWRWFTEGAAISYLFLQTWKGQCKKNIFNLHKTNKKIQSGHEKIQENGYIKFQKWLCLTRYKFGTVNSKGHNSCFLQCHCCSSLYFECKCIAEMTHLFPMSSIQLGLNDPRRQRKGSEDYFDFPLGWFWHLMMDSLAWLSGRKAGLGTIKTRRQSVVHRC